METRPVGGRVVPFRRTDRHDDPNSRSSQFCEQAVKNSLFCMKYILQGCTEEDPRFEITVVHSWYRLPLRCIPFLWRLLCVCYCFRATMVTGRDIATMRTGDVML